MSATSLATRSLGIAAVSLFIATPGRAQCPAVSAFDGLQWNGYNRGVAAEVHVQILASVRVPVGLRAVRVQVHAFDLWPRGSYRCRPLARFSP